MDDRTSRRRGATAGSRGQSEPLGALLVIGLSIAAASAIVLLGGAALDSTQEQSDVQRAEHVMTLFDSRAATVALGDADVGSLQLPGSGSYEVRDETGWIRIRHTNYSDGNGEQEEIYNATLGSVVYGSGETTIAYQGGGVWRTDRAGNASMVSPPEFHYRDSTLTFPVVRVSGSGAVSGGSTAVVTKKMDARQVFPNRSANYNESDPPDRVYTNPAENGSMAVTIQSDYYTGWAAYFRSRTTGNVTVDHDNETVTLDLFTLGSRGGFEMPSDPDDASGGNTELLVRGLGGKHNLDEFTITLIDDPDDSAKMNNLEWSMWAEEGQKQLELHLRDASGDKVKATVYYSDDGGATYHGWKNDTAFEIVETDIDSDGEDETVLEVDWTGDTKMTYSALSSSDVTHFDNPDTLADPVSWDEHDAPVFKNGGSQPEEDGVKFNTTDTDKTHLGDVTNHYFALMGSEFTLKVDDKNSNTVSEEASSGEINYPGSDRYITFLHVTENEIQVDID